jgi:hypothetical protein
MKYLEHVDDREENCLVAKHMVNDVVKISERENLKKIKLMLDLEDLGSSGYLPRESRIEYSKLTELPNMGKIAVCGGNAHLRVVINFIITITRKKRIYKFFKDKKLAIRWLKT